MEIRDNVFSVSEVSRFFIEKGEKRYVGSTTKYARYLNIFFKDGKDITIDFESENDSTCRAEYKRLLEKFEEYNSPKTSASGDNSILSKLIYEVEKNNFECQAGGLENCQAWLDLKTEIYKL